MELPNSLMGLVNRAIPPNTTGSDEEDIEDSQARSGLAVFAYPYITIALYLLAKYFLLPSLDIITAKTSATPSVAGTLIVGGATSFQYLVLSIITVLVGEEDVKTSAIFGGHIYGFTFLAGLSIICVPKSLLQTVLLRPLMRDILAVLFVLGVVMAFGIDEQLDWWENLVLILIFFFYTLLVRILRQFMKTNKIDDQKLSIEMEEDNAEAENNKEVTGPSLSLTFSTESSCLDKVFHIICLPIKVMFKFTVPPPSFKLFGFAVYPLTLLISFIWEGFLLWVMVITLTDLGRLIGVPPVITGLIFAAPVSLNFVLCILLGQRGDLAMAIHAILGRTIIHPTILLGVPKLLYNIVFLSEVQIETDGSLVSLVFLILAIILLVLMVAISRGRLTKPWSIPPLVFYILNVIVAIVFEYGYIKSPFQTYVGLKETEIICFAF